MNVERLIAKVEGGSVEADLRLASTTRTLLLRAEENPTIQQAKRRMDPEDLLLILDRSARLFERPGPSGYAHPDDLSLCAYIYLLASTQHPGARDLVERVAREDRPEFAAANAVARHCIAMMAATTPPHVP